MLGTRRQVISDVAIGDPRRGKRFSLALPCHVTSPYAGSIRIAGTTLNMSRTGALVRFYHLDASEVLPKVGEAAPLEIDLPTSPSFAPRYLQCMAVVARVMEVETDYLAVAFELRRVRVEERHKKASSDTEAIFEAPAGSGPVQ